ncbi:MULTISPECIES: hypothetical protein [Rhodonellum]|nr:MULTISPECIES: hypothetical protein [Rhodonellum]SDZ49115.1 hypothetical protein SAMN05444412_11754 [Rhodonellum ikkaensis]
MNLKRSHTAMNKGLLVFVFLIFSGMEVSWAQRISFSTWTGSDDIILTSPQGAMPGLNFNQKQAAITASSEAVVIGITDGQTVIYEIEAPEGFDLVVEVDAPNVLALEGNAEETVPFQLRIAYNNQSAADHLSGKGSAIELPLGFNTIVFPVNRRMSGAPGPPPTPEHGGYTRPKAKAYLYLYATLGPIGAVLPGVYEGNININVSFSSYD